MRNLLIIAKLSILENSRKQIFHVLLLLMLTIIASSTMLTVFTEGVKLKMLKDLCMSVIGFGGAILAIALSATAIPNDLEQKTAYPTLARPLTRAHYLFGKYLGTLLTVAVGILAMAFAFGVLIFSYQPKADLSYPLAILYIILASGVMASIATVLSTVTSPAITSAISFMAYLGGCIKMGTIHDQLVASTSPALKILFSIPYHLLPNLECFNLKDLFIYRDTIPVSYLLQVFGYGVFYILFALLAAAALFSRKEL